MYELEREVVKEKDRLKKEMEVQIQETKNKLLNLAHSRLESVYTILLLCAKMINLDNKANYGGK
jgi:hypothetical protein